MASSDSTCWTVLREAASGSREAREASARRLSDGAIAERVAQATPDEGARRRALGLAEQLPAKEVMLRQRARSAPGEMPSLLSE